tara:strand:- start:541 stop:804 length:264 start_codon:yes stop_codon:yes gene_type:complete
MGDLRNELLAFPYGKNDDLADALAMQLELWRRTRSVKELQESEPEEFTFEAIIKELRARHAPPKGIMDVLHTGSCAESSPCELLARL